MHLIVQNAAKKTHRPAKVWNSYGLNAQKKNCLSMENKKIVTKH